MKVFVSTTTKDLQLHLRRVIEAIESLGLTAIQMDDWGAIPGEPLTNTVKSKYPIFHRAKLARKLVKCTIDSIF